MADQTPHQHTRVPRWALSAAGAVSRRLGVTAESRRATLRTMQDKDAADTGVYWFQLGVATGIATLGLVLGSTGVVIGAMLIAPLMTPILELAMALAIGHARLLVRSTARILGSIVAVIGAAFLLVRLLPFEDPSSEILSRTAPTLLDLGIAMLCALAAVITTSRPFSSAASAGAGTAIGISLVPPLCVVGFGLGIGDAAIAQGALLLFVANLSAILACATAIFPVVGFRSRDQDDPSASAPAGWHRALSASIERGLHSRWRLLWRLGTPAVLLLAVSVPLTRALQHVAFEVRTRAAVNAIVSSDPILRDAVSVTSRISQEDLSLRAVIIGTVAAAQETSDRVARAITLQTGLVPEVTVRAVRMDQPVPVRRAAAPLPPPSAGEVVAGLDRRLVDAIARLWPAPPHPALLGRRLAIAADAVRLRLVVNGAVAPDLNRRLEQALSAVAGLPVQVDVTPVGAPVTGLPHQALAWWDAAAIQLEALAVLPPTWQACFTLPSSAGADSDAEMAARVTARAEQLTSARAAVSHGPAFSLQLSPAPCATLNTANATAVAPIRAR